MKTTKSKFYIFNTILTIIFLSGLNSCTDDTNDDEAALLFALLNESSPPTECGSTEVTQSGSDRIISINATATNCWVRISLSDGRLSDDSHFDMSFQRFKVQTTSGLTHSEGQGGSCNTGRTDLASISDLNTGTEAVAECNSGIEEDVSLGIDGGGEGGAPGSQTWTGSPSMEEWYTYSQPILTAKDDVYVVRSGTGENYFLVQFIDYYSHAGTSGYPKIRVRAL